VRSTSSYITMACESIPIFANDGTIDSRELDHLVRLALDDGVVDQDERRVFRNILATITPGRVTKEVWDRIQSLKKAFDL
jgi:hypothetical protein